MELTQEIVKEFLDYFPESGLLVWKERGVRWFERTKQNTSEQKCRQWNTKYAFKEAGTFDFTNGYRQITILGKRYVAHRIIWLWMTGEWPIGEVDHENGNGFDNRFDNIRNVKHSVNMKNRKICTRNTSGYRGVYFKKDKNKWAAKIDVNGERRHLGYRDTPELAFELYVKAAKEAGFTDRHIYGKRM